MFSQNYSETQKIAVLFLGELHKLLEDRRVDSCQETQISVDISWTNNSQTLSKKLTLKQAIKLRPLLANFVACRRILIQKLDDMFYKLHGLKVNFVRSGLIQLVQVAVLQDNKIAEQIDSVNGLKAFWKLRNATWLRNCLVRGLSAKNFFFKTFMSFSYFKNADGEDLRNNSPIFLSDTFSATRSFIALCS